jgi:hypothetical protein
MSHQCITDGFYHYSTTILTLLTLFYNYLGEYQRLVSGYDNKTKRKLIKNDNYDDIDYEYGGENKLDDKSINFDGNNCDEIEARNEQMKRLSHLQNLAGDTGDIPGKSRIMNFSYKFSAPKIYYLFSTT